MSVSNAAASNRRTINHYSCDYCRFKHKTCIRNRPGEVCESCRDLCEPCSPGRTAQQYREMQWGEHGLLKLRIFQTGGLQNLSEVSHAKMKEFQREMWQLLSRWSPDAASSAASIRGSNLGVSAPDLADLPDAEEPSFDGGISPSPFLMDIDSADPCLVSAEFHDRESVLPEAETPAGGSAGTPYRAFSRSRSHFSSHASSSTLDPLLVCAESTESSFGPLYVEPPSSLVQERGETANTIVSNALATETDTVKLLAKLDHLKEGYGSIQNHVKDLCQQRLDNNETYISLTITGGFYRSQITALINEIETTLSESSKRDIGSHLSFYQTLAKSINGYDLPIGRQTSLLTKAHEFLQRHGFSADAESVCHLLKTIEGYQELAVKSIEDTCNGISATYKNLLSQEEFQPSFIHPTPLPFLHRALRFPSLFLTILEKQSKRTEPPIDLMGQNIVHAAASSGDTKLLKVSLERYPSLINERDYVGRTPLFITTTANKAQDSELLLKSRADPNVRGTAGHTLLETCAGLGYLPIIQLLVEHGAYVHSNPVITWTPLEAAAAAGHFEVVDFLLKTSKCRPKFRSLDGKTARELALQFGHTEIVQRLELED